MVFNSKVYSQDLVQLEDYIFDVHADKSKYILQQGIVIYKKNDKWFVPFEELTKILGFYIEGLNSSGIFEGYIRSESLDYKVNFNTCEIKLDGKLISKDCDSVLFVEQIWFLEIQIIEKLFNSLITMNSSTQVIDLFSLSGIYPTLLRETLQGKSTSLERNKEKKKDRIEIIEAPYNYIDGANLYQRLSYNTIRLRDSAGNKNEIIHDIYANAEILKMTSEINVSRDQGKYNIPWAALKRKDPGNNIGGLGLSNIEVGNINAPNTNFLLSSGKLTGVLFSNKQLELSTNSNFQNFQGELKRGWLVELYQNDILIGSMESNQDQRYDFQQVLLVVGQNKFHLIFYGPHGEVEHSYITYTLSSEFISERNFEFTGVSAVNELGEQDSMFTLNTRLHKQLLASFFVKNDDRLRTQLDLKGFFRGTSYALTSAQSDQGQVYGAESSFVLGDYFVNANYYNFENYLNYGVKLFNELDYQSRISLFFPLFDHFQIQQSYRSFKFENSQLKTEEYVNRLAFPIYMFYLAHEATWDKVNYNGEFFTRLNLFGFLQRISAKYQEEFEWTNYTLESNFNNNKLSYSILFDKKIQEKLLEVSFSMQKTLKNFFVFLNSSINDFGDKSLTVGLGNLLSVNATTDHYSFAPPAQKEYGQVLVIAFDDRNHDGVKDEFEPFVKDLKIRDGNTNRNFITDEKGEVFIDLLPAWQDAKLDYFTEDLKSIYLTLAKNTQVFYIRPGKTITHYLPLRILGEIYGTILLNKKSKINMLDLTVRVYFNDLLVQEIKPEDDGYYFLGKLNLAKYKVVVFDKLSKKELLVEDVVLIDPEDPVLEKDLLL